MTAMVLCCFGAFAVTLNSTAVTAFPTNKIRALLSYLALEAAQPLSREALAVLFWPEMPPTAALNNLRLAVHRLRATVDKVQPGLGAALIESTRQTVGLNRALITSDVQAFQRLLTACATHRHIAQPHCAECRARLVEAATLYRGELLAGFGLADAPAFEAWLLLQRETFHQQALAVLNTLVQSYEHLGNDEQVHTYASRQVALEPSHEEAHRQIMRSLARRGLRSEALAHYETCRRLLREQVNVEPEAATVALVEQIRVGLFDNVRGWTDDKAPAQQAASAPAAARPSSPHPVAPALHDWSEAPAVHRVYGRQAELAQLAQWLAPPPAPGEGQARVRLVAILGIGGVGKTTLTAATVKAVAPSFERVLWRALVNAPPLDELLRDMLQRLASERRGGLPMSLDGQLALLLADLRQQRCLLVLDNLESIMLPDQPGQMRPGYTEYAQLLQLLAEHEHQSTVLLTSREQPHSLEEWAAASPCVRILALEGLSTADGQTMITARGLQGSVSDTANLVARYSGNPLALKLVVQTVHELFDGDVAAFLAVDAAIFDDIRAVLDQQFTRLSAVEQELLLWLAIEREPVTLQVLCHNLVPAGQPHLVLETLRSLQRRSLVSQSAQGFLLQNVITEYLTEYLVEQVYQELLEPAVAAPLSTRENPKSNIQSGFLKRFVLLKATAKEYVRASQMRLIIEPIVTRLQATLGKAGLIANLNQCVTLLQSQAPWRGEVIPGYTAGNLLNLLLYLGVNLRGYTFARLAVWQAYLQGQHLPEVNFTQADLANSVFTNLFGEILALQFDSAGELLVAGLIQGKLCLWHALGGQLLREYQSFGAGAAQTRFSQDGEMLAVANTDHKLYLWAIKQQQLHQVLTGHHESLWDMAFTADKKCVAGAGRSGTIYVWDVTSGLLCHTIQHHTTAVPTLTFSPDGRLLASGDVDGQLCVWQINDTAPPTLVQHLGGHRDEVHIVAFASNTILVSGSHDNTLRIWDVERGQTRHMLAHTRMIRALALSADGTLLASGGGDTYVCLWDVHSGQLLHTLPGFVYRTIHLSFRADGRLLATVGADQTVALWEVATGRRLEILQVHSNHLHTVAFSPDGKMLASGGTDGLIRLWDAAQPGSDRAPTAKRQPSNATRIIRTLHGHIRWIYDVAFRSPMQGVGTLLVSAGRESVIRLWEVESGRLFTSFTEHGDEVEAIGFSPDGQWLASACQEAVSLWEVAALLRAAHSAKPVVILQGHTGRILSFAFSPDGRWVATGSTDRTVRVWDLTKRGAFYSLIGHTNGVNCVAFHPHGALLATSSFDQTVRLWDAATGQLVGTLPTQSTITNTLAFHPQGALLATAAKDHTISLWDIAEQRLIITLHGHTDQVECIRFSPDGQWLAGASADETISLWEVRTGVCRQVYHVGGPYAGMNITGVTGISTAQKAALKALGAFESAEAA